jgi:hypothetical protein
VVWVGRNGSPSAALLNISPPTAAPAARAAARSTALGGGSSGPHLLVSFFFAAFSAFASCTAVTNIESPAHKDREPGLSRSLSGLFGQSVRALPVFFDFLTFGHWTSGLSRSFSGALSHWPCRAY